MSEAKLQVAVAQLLDLHGFLWMHTPNEGKRKRSTGGRLKAAGLKRGVPDVLIFDRPNQAALLGAPGVAIELKWDRGRTTPDQAAWLEDLTARGWVGEVCRSIDDVLELLGTCYKGGRPPRVKT